MVQTRRGRSTEASAEPESAQDTRPEAAPRARNKGKGRAAPAPATVAPKKKVTDYIVTDYGVTEPPKKTRRTRATAPDEASPLRAYEAPKRTATRASKQKGESSKAKKVQVQVPETADEKDEDDDTGLFFKKDGELPNFLSQKATFISEPAKHPVDRHSDDDDGPDSIDYAQANVTAPELPTHPLVGDAQAIAQAQAQAQAQADRYVPATWKIRFAINQFGPDKYEEQYRKIIAANWERRPNPYKPNNAMSIFDWLAANDALHKDLGLMAQENHRLHMELNSKDQLLSNAQSTIDQLNADIVTARREGAQAAHPQNDPLLKKIMKSRDEARAAQKAGRTNTNSVDEDTDTDDEDDDMDVDAQDASQQLAIAAPTATPAAAQPAQTPNTVGWGLGSLFSKVASVVFSTAAPATAPQQPPTLSFGQVQQIGNALTPDPTPTRQAKRGLKQKKKSKKASKKTRTKGDFAHAAMVEKATQGIVEDQRELAEAWASKMATRLTKQSASPQVGEKRQALEQPMRIKDVKEIPSRRPWEAEGSYGLLPEFFDNSDSDSDEGEVPGWYALDSLVGEQPAFKKRKIHSGAGSPNGQATHTTTSLSDSKGKSASLTDMHPRPSHIPSPMFENPVVHQTGANVFEERQTQAPGDEERTALQKQLRKYGHVEGSGTYCVPESDSEEDRSELSSASIGEGASLTAAATSSGNAAGELPWTQAPPAAPTPAHAQLPVPVAAPPTVPEIQGTPKAGSVDPLEFARAQAMKHTPARPSRLREAMLPSPSIRSDSGLSPAGGAIPGVHPLDFDSDELYAEAEVWSKAPDVAAQYGSGAALTYSESDENISE